MLLVDTNVWLAANDRSAREHQQCRALLVEHQAMLAAPVPVITETSWMLLDRLGPASQSGFMRMVTSGRVTPIDLTTEDWERVVELIEGYASQQLDVIDASIIAVAERLNLTEIATMNGRDFYVVRPKHCAGFTLLPDGITRHA